MKTPKTAVTHTLTPWKLKNEEEGYGAFVIQSEENQFITDVSYWDKPNEEPQRGWLTYDQAKANAAYIVTAVNAHEAMKTALEQILRMSPATPVYDVAWNVLNSLRRAEGV